METKELSKAGALLTKIDLQPHHARRAEIKAEKARVSAAQTSRDEQIEAISKEIRRLEASGADGEEAANVLLRGGSIREVANAAILQADRATLMAAGRPLAQARDDAKAAEEQSKSALMGELSPIGDMALEAVPGEIAATVMELAGMYAAITAIANATGSSNARNMAVNLSEVLQHARLVCMDGYGLPITVPKEVVSTLERGRAAIELAGRSITATVPWPKL